jgi:carboxylate-amine ligase
MTISEPPFSIGIEEEYLLVDPATGELVENPPPELMAEAEAALGGQVSPEFMQCQIEVGTRVCDNIAEARDDLKRLRATVAGIARRHGLAPIAASTHPFANWDRQHHTHKERYEVLARDLQRVARRLLISGMHVHVGIGDDDLRIDLLGQVGYFLPHLLALSTSSPFWRGTDTGLKSYRIAVWDELPRTGLPEQLDSFGEYTRLVEAMVGAGLIGDATKLWWDVRPSARYPTLEMRITDLCTRLEDTICLAAIYTCILRMLYRLRRNNQRWRRYPAMLINENRWRAQRYGFDEGLVDFGLGRVVPYADLLEELLAYIEEDAEALCCRAEVGHARTILARGTSAHRQLGIYNTAVAGGAEPTEALRAVVRDLVTETVADL